MVEAPPAPPRRPQTRRQRFEWDAIPLGRLQLTYVWATHPDEVRESIAVFHRELKARFDENLARKAPFLSEYFELEIEPVEQREGSLIDVADLKLKAKKAKKALKDKVVIVVISTASSAFGGFTGAMGEAALEALTNQDEQCQETEGERAPRVEYKPPLSVGPQNTIRYEYPLPKHDDPGPGPD